MCHVGHETGQLPDCRRAQSFCTTLKRPDAGRSRRLQRGRAAGRSPTHGPTARGRPRRLARQTESPGRQSTARGLDDVGRRQPAKRGPGRAAWQPRRAAGRVAVRGARTDASGGGARAPGPETRTHVAVRGWLRSSPRPPSTRASRADRTRGRQRGRAGHGSRVVAAPEPARSTGCGSTAYGAVTGVLLSMIP
jgi:hypothetical protein